MRTSFAEDLSPQGPIVATDRVVEALRQAVSAVLVSPERGLDALVGALEAALWSTEALLATSAGSRRGVEIRAVREMRAFLWALLPMELYVGGTRASHREATI